MKPGRKLLRMILGRFSKEQGELGGMSCRCWCLRALELLVRNVANQVR